MRVKKFTKPRRDFRVETGVQDGISGQEGEVGLMSGRGKKGMTLPHSLLEIQTIAGWEG